MLQSNHRIVSLVHSHIAVLQSSFFFSLFTYFLSTLLERLLKLVLVKLDLSIEPVTICDQFTLVFILRPQIVVLNVLFIVYKGSV